MPLVNWDDSCKINIAVIDVQHQQLFKLLNMLHDSITKKEEGRGVKYYIQELVFYAKIHFAQEESFFSRFKFPGSLDHKHEHLEFINKVVEYQKEIDSAESSDSSIAIQMLCFLKEWLVHHIMVIDRKYADYIAENFPDSFLLD